MQTIHELGKQFLRSRTSTSSSKTVPDFLEVGGETFLLFFIAVMRVMHQIQETKSTAC